MSIKHEGRVKILMLGESGVGKSSILLRFTENKFSNDFVTTLGVEYKQKVLNVENKNILVQVWDTAGQERFRTITPVYYRSVNGVVVTYDITDKESFNSINYWMKNMEESADIKNLDIVLVGNKNDLKEKREITFEQGQQMAQQYGIEFYETSAKINSKVDEIFQHLSEKIIKRNGIVTGSLNGKQDEGQKLRGGQQENNKNESKSCCN